MKLKEQVIFFELINDLLHAGFQLQNALVFIGQVDAKRYKTVVNVMVQRMVNGQSFAMSIKPFIEAEISWQIELAEAHGSLPATIAILAQNLQQRLAQQRKLRQLMQYPMVLIGLLVAVGIFLRFYFIEQLMHLKGTDNSGQIVNLSSIGILLIFGAIGCLLVYWWFRHLSVPNKLMICLKIPLLKSLVKEQVSYQLSFTFALLLQAGHSYQEISQLFLKLPQKSMLHHLGGMIAKSSHAGENITTYMRGIPYIPIEFTLFFSRGKTNVEVGNDLLAYSKICFQKVIRRYERLLAMIQPVMFITIAIGIVSMYAAMLLPMYKMIGDLR